MRKEKNTFSFIRSKEKKTQSFCILNMNKRQRHVCDYYYYMCIKTKCLVFPLDFLLKEIIK